MIVPKPGQFELVLISDVWPQGTTVTPGVINTYGSYASLMSTSEVTDDAYGILINISGNGVSASARDGLGKLGVDPAGGTSYVDTIVDLGIACAGTLSASNGGNGGIWYYFPIFIKAASSLGFAASVNNAIAGTCTVFCRLFCRPSGPVPRVGTFVRTFGSTPLTSTGTAVTPNSAGSKSSYVQLGSAVADNLWYWCLGVGCNNVAMNNNASTWDLAIGDATNKRNVIVDQLVNPSSVEQLAYSSLGAFANAGSGDLVYVRAGGSAASPTGMSAIAYGVGG